MTTATIHDFNFERSARAMETVPKKIADLIMKGHIAALGMQATLIGEYLETTNRKKYAYELQIIGKLLSALGHDQPENWK
jgi:hypothetical protein